MLRRNVARSPSLRTMVKCSRCSVVPLAKTANAGCMPPREAGLRMAVASATDGVIDGPPGEL